MSFGLLGLQQELKKDAIGGLGNAANMEQQRNAANQQLKQARRQQTMSNVGTGAGIGMLAGGPLGALVGAGAGFIFDRIF